MSTALVKGKTSLLDSSFPVLVPTIPALRANPVDFRKYLDDILNSSDESATKVGKPSSKGSRKRYMDDNADQIKKQKLRHEPGKAREREASPSNTENLAALNLESQKGDDDFTLVSETTSSYVDVQNDRQPITEDAGARDDSKESSANAKELSSPTHPFMDALRGEMISDRSENEYPENKMFTDNLGIAYRSTNSALLDLFTELERTISGARLRELLEGSWRESPLNTMKIVLNARSIHLGKGERESFYRCLGWLRVHHPKTLLVNLDLLTKPLIDKKPAVEKETADTKIQRNKETEPHQRAGDSDEVQFGLAHGYWKDLLAVLVLDVNDKLNFNANPRSILNAKNDQSKRDAQRDSKKGSSTGSKMKQKLASKFKPKDVEMISDETPEQSRLKSLEFDAEQRKDAKQKKHDKENMRHERFLLKFEEPFHRALHLTVARLFAEQLEKDLVLLESGKKKNINCISMAAKWAPSPEGFHDKNTFIASTIAEILYKPTTDTTGDRTEYLKKARASYRTNYLSPLRAALDVVERKISKEKFEEIDYKTVPSEAMNTYKDLFAKKDLSRFQAYIEDVASGKSRISGATLNPGQLVKQVSRVSPSSSEAAVGAKKLLENKMIAIQEKTVNAQWQTLVQRIKDSGKLENSIAVCDISGSMGTPIFPDSTCPMDSSIALSILLSDITAPPFGGTMISFAADPHVHNIPANLPFSEKVRLTRGISMGFNTDFVAVFLRCILPVAIKNKLKKEDMVKQVFVFSDMQFDQAEDDNTYSYSWLKSKKPQCWATNYGVIKQKFEEHGYDVPRLIFWNLAGGRTHSGYSGDSTVPKPVLQDTPKTAIVSGYSQGMLKTFLEGGDFDDADVEMDEGEKTDATGEKDQENGNGKAAKNALQTMMKAIGHQAYSGLTIVD